MAGLQQPDIDIEALIAGIGQGNRRMIAKTMTLIESSVPAHQEAAHAVLDRILPRTGNSVRLGITGVPGVGKSTFIENLGVSLADQGHRVAVLAVDPQAAGLAVPFSGTRPGWSSFPPTRMPLSDPLLQERHWEVWPPGPGKLCWSARQRDLM